MIGGVMMRLFRSVFREQKTRLAVDWLTHTDELIIQYLDQAGEEDPASIATELDRSVEYVSDRCRQLSLRGLLEVVEHGTGETAEYRVSELGMEYLNGEVDPEELEDLTATPTES